MELKSPVAVATAARVNDRASGCASVHVLDEPGRTVVCVHGEIDMVTAGHLEQVLQEVGSTARDVIVVDLRRVRFMDSSGLHVIARARETLARRGCALRVRNSPRHVRRLFAASGCDALLGS